MREPTRRDVLKAGIGAAALLAAGPRESRAQEQEQDKKKLLLLSNSSFNGQFLTYAAKEIQEHFGASENKHKKILFIPYAKKDHQTYTDKIIKALKPLGIDIVAVPENNPTAALDEVDGIFIGGGNTFRLLDELQKTGMLSAIRDKVNAGMPYMGSSAGINVAAPTIQTSNDMPIVEPESLKAMALVPFQINPHYVEGAFYSQSEKGNLLDEIGHSFLAMCEEMLGADMADKVKTALKLAPYNGETRAERIAEFHEENKVPVLGLREGSILRVTGKKVELLGDMPAFWFEHGKKEPSRLMPGDISRDMKPEEPEKSARRA